MFVAHIQIPLGPKGTARPRACVRKGGKASTYTPAKTRQHQDELCIILATHPDKPSAPLDCPIGLAITAHMPRPKSLRSRDEWCTTKPDVDNLAKGVMDALVRAGWIRDDALVCRLVVGKVYHLAGVDSPHYAVLVREEGRAR